MPAQESSQVRSAWSAIVGGHGAPGEADSSTQKLAALVKHALLNDLIRTDQDRLRDRQAECLGGLEVDHQFVLRRLLHGQVAWLGSFEDLVHVDGRASNLS